MFELLTIHHCPQLLDFELENKSWFESLIAAREDGFYSLSGVQKHIEQLVTAMNEGNGYSVVVTKGEQIVARANLKNIDGTSAYIGYRVAKVATGQGTAQRCLNHLINHAKQCGLQKLKAQVLVNNPVSKHILEKAGFRLESSHLNFTQLNGQSIDCLTLSKLL